MIDLTHPLSPEAPSWNGTCGFCFQQKNEGLFSVQQIEMQAGIGTHMDAPAHCVKGGLSIADIPLENLFVPTCILDISAKAGPDYELTVSDVEEYEKRYGAIPENALVIAFTGWCRFWSDPQAYRNVDVNGKMHFPAFSSAAADYLLKRNIAGIAIDTLSPDCADCSFPVHQKILGAGKYIIENIADCSKVPARGAHALALPMKINQGTESPIRIIAFKTCDLATS